MNDFLDQELERGEAWAVGWQLSAAMRRNPWSKERREQGQVSVAPTDAEWMMSSTRDSRLTLDENTTDAVWNASSRQVGWSRSTCEQPRTQQARQVLGLFVRLETSRRRAALLACEGFMLGLEGGQASFGGLRGGELGSQGLIGGVAGLSGGVECGRGGGQGLGAVLAAASRAGARRRPGLARRWRPGRRPEGLARLVVGGGEGQLGGGGGFGPRLARRWLA